MTKKEFLQTIEDFLSRTGMAPSTFGMEAFDACNGIIWRDDALICSLLVKKRYAANPRLELQIKPEETTLFGKVSLWPDEKRL